MSMFDTYEIGELVEVSVRLEDSEWVTAMVIDTYEVLPESAPWRSERATNYVLLLSVGNDVLHREVSPIHMRKKK